MSFGLPPDATGVRRCRGQLKRFHARGSLFGAIEGVFPKGFQRDQAGRGVS